MAVDVSLEIELITVELFAQSRALRMQHLKRGVSHAASSGAPSMCGRPNAADLIREAASLIVAPGSRYALMR